MGGDETEVGGTMPQRIASCMEALGALMALPHAVGASMVLADKRRAKAAGGQQDLVHQVANILGAGRHFPRRGSGFALDYIIHSDRECVCRYKGFDQGVAVGESGGTRNGLPDGR